MCQNLITKRNPKFHNAPFQNPFITYPCGKCAECLNKKFAEWLFRLEQESKTSLSGCFVTLTYDEKNLPKYGANKRDCQLFFMRLRKYIQTHHKDENIKIRYYLQSEYGTKNTLRCHYHIILFNFSNEKIIKQVWGKGIVTVSNLNEERIKYTLKYINKPAFLPEGKNKNFSLKSQGLGKSYLTPQTIEYHKRDLSFCRIRKPNGHFQNLPKFFKEKIYTTEKERTQITNYQNQRVQELKYNRALTLSLKYRISHDEALVKLELSQMNLKTQKRDNSFSKL
jgi:hypothetical protein